jgi:hypothetical protein
MAIYYKPQCAVFESIADLGLSKGAQNSAALVYRQIQRNAVFLVQYLKHVHVHAN